MIEFFADGHYGAEPGEHIYRSLSAGWREKIAFHRCDWQPLESGEWEKECPLLVLHMIGGTCGEPHPGEGAEKAVRRYCERGGNLLLLHGSSAAFWQWNWWRKIVGMRWVRPNDPDGVPASTHPHAPCSVYVTKSAHPLAGKLCNFELPEDEIYTALEQTAPVMTLMECQVNGKSEFQCCEAISPWGGKIVSFIPGHKPECTENPILLRNIETLLEYLTVRR